jgi:low affinity Fe/Cu permease
MPKQSNNSKSRPVPNQQRSGMNEAFRQFAQKVSHLVGTSWAFIVAIAIVVVWGTTGPIFHFSDTWQLVINTGTTIITFLMVFLIQNTQNRQDTAIQIKLDELIKGVKGARTSLVDIEDISDEELDRLHKQFERLHRVEEKHARARRKDSDE